MSNKSKKVQQKARGARIVPDRAFTWINALGSLLFALFCFWFLAVYKGDLMFRIQELSLFLFDKHFFAQHLHSPGGLLEYAGQFLTQFFYYPWLGAVMLTLLIMLGQWMLVRAFDLPKRLSLLSILPLALVLLYPAMQEYSIFVAKYSILSQVLGMLVCVLPLFIAGFIHKTQAKVVLLLLYAPFTYPVLGFYALLGSLLLWIRLFRADNSSKQALWHRQALLLVYLLLIPPLFFLLSAQHINPAYLFLYGLPIFDYPNTPLMWTAPVAFSLLMITMALLRYNLKGSDRWMFWLNLSFLPLAVLLVQVGSYKDVNFNTQLAMERAISHNDWDRVIDLARKSGDKPNRLIVNYRNTALYNKNQLCDRMFTFPNSDESFHTNNTLVSNTIIGAPIHCFYYGLLNYSYRWNMENMVLFGPRLENIRFMMLSALLNHEMDLARKYIHVLQQTLFYKRWASEHTVYLDNPALLMENEQYKTLLALTRYENELGMDQRVIELTILNHFSNLQSGTDEMLEWSMSSILTTKNVYKFWPMFFVYVNKELPLPKHVQEAALLLAYFEKRDLGDLTKLMDPNVLRRFEEFKRRTEANTHLTENQLGNLLKKPFEKTYWYYFCFIKDLKTN